MTIETFDNYGQNAFDPAYAVQAVCRAQEAAQKLHQLLISAL